jgi:hypothetical protein
MKYLYGLVSFCLCIIQLHAQETNSLDAEVKNAATGELLQGVSVRIYASGKISGLISNKEGRFVIRHDFDSLKLSMIGYQSITYRKTSGEQKMLDFHLTQQPVMLEEVTVNPLSATDIIKKTIAAIPGFQPKNNFQSRGFYREIIKDREHYFSVAEATFLSQYFPSKKSFKLQLEQGRSKEEVAYTRLFEDFHPGGGPQWVASESLVTSIPDFLNLKKIHLFQYKKEKMQELDGKRLYCISFNQEPNAKEALEKGKIYIDAEDYGIVQFEAENSPYGTPYIKNLTGTDKIFASILHIDFKRKGWKRNIEFVKIDDQRVMSHVTAQLQIGYKQPRKNIELDLTIKAELLMTDLMVPVTTEITKVESWKREDLAMNLPTDFDAHFWGQENIISPTEEIKRIVESISRSNQDTLKNTMVEGWHYINKNLFLTQQQNDTILMLPLMKSLWEDEQTGGMMYRTEEGDFSIESNISLTKKTNNTEMPDKGFQQAGIIVRSGEEKKENYILLALGSGGSGSPKLFFKRTIDDKTKSVIMHEQTMNGTIRIIKKAGKLKAFFRPERRTEWEDAGEYEADWLNRKLQVGLALFAHFSGDGPKMKPDMQVVFSGIQIQGI